VNELEVRTEFTPLAFDLQRGAAIARQLRDYIAQARMTVRLPRGGEHVRIEGWQVLCHLCQLPLPSIINLRREDREGGYVYVAEASLAYGGREYRAYGICASDEPNWRGKPEFQLASMAQTRAAGKVLRLLLGWIVTLAGYEPTPAEEMIYEPTPPNTPTPAAPQGGTQRRVPDPELQPPIDAPADDDEPREGNGHDHSAEQATLLRDLQRTDRDRYNRILRALHAQARQRFVDDDARRQWLHENYGKWSFPDLTVAQAREALQLMQETPA
jgi:hypothetical protein